MFRSLALALIMFLGSLTLLAGCTINHNYQYELPEELERRLEKVEGAILDQRIHEMEKALLEQRLEQQRKVDNASPKKRRSVREWLRAAFYGNST